MEISLFFLTANYCTLTEIIMALHPSDGEMAHGEIKREKKQAEWSYLIKCCHLTQRTPSNKKVSGQDCDKEMVFQNMSHTIKCSPWPHQFSYVHFSFSFYGNKDPNFSVSELKRTHFLIYSCRLKSMLFPFLVEKLGDLCNTKAPNYKSRH